MSRKTPEWMADFEKPCFSLELVKFSKARRMMWTSSSGGNTEYKRWTRRNSSEALLFHYCRNKRTRNYDCKGTRQTTFKIFKRHYKRKWRRVRTEFTHVFSKKLPVLFFWEEVTFQYLWRWRVFLQPSGPCLKTKEPRSKWFRQQAKRYSGINSQENKKSSSNTTTPWCCKEPFGGFFRCILVFEPEMSPGSCAGEMHCRKRILKQDENFSFGERREDQK